jgi:type II secretory pathway pseudopilin PulG
MTNSRKNILKLAFTIYEMAIVLVVVGVIAAMVVKGSAIIRTTEIKAELLKIDRIRSAVANFEQQNNRLPGDTTSLGIITTAQGNVAKSELYALASLSPNDFEAPYDNASEPLVWQFARCNTFYQGTATSGYREILGASISATDAREFVCVGLYHSTSNIFVNMPRSLIGGYELYFDDANTATGVGRCAGTSGCATGALKDNKTELRNYISDATMETQYFIRVW